MLSNQQRKKPEDEHACLILETCFYNKGILNLEGKKKTLSIYILKCQIYIFYIHKYLQIDIYYKYIYTHKCRIIRIRRNRAGYETGHFYSYTKCDFFTNPIYADYLIRCRMLSVCHVTDQVGLRRLFIFTAVLCPTVLDNADT